RLAVRRTSYRDEPVLRQRTVGGLQQLLQLGLGVLRRPLGIELREPLVEDAQHGGARRRVATVEEYRAEERLQRVGEDRGARLRGRHQLAFAQAQQRRQAELARQLGERLGAHQARAQPRELSLGQRGVAAVELLGDGAAEHAVAQEFEPFVVQRAVAAVRQRLLEQLGFREAVAERALQVRGPRADLLPSRARRVVDVEADVAEERHFLAVRE